MQPGLFPDLTPLGGRALVLAAGRGERLRPVTDTLPKPLVPVLGRPVIVPALEWLAAYGLTDVAINTHWLPDCLHAALGDGSGCGVTLHWRHEPALLEGAGTLKSFEGHFGWHTALVLNGDTLFELDLAAALATHRAAGAVLTLVCEAIDGPLQRPVAWDRDGRLVGIRRQGLDDPRGCCRGEFRGLHLVEPEVWRRHIRPGQPTNLVVDVIPRLLARGLPVAVHLAPGPFADIGDPASLARAHLLALHHRLPRFLAGAEEVSFGVWARPGARVLGTAVPPVFLDREAVVASGAVAGPYAVLGAGRRLDSGQALSYATL